MFIFAIVALGASAVLLGRALLPSGGAAAAACPTSSAGCRKALPARAPRAALRTQKQLKDALLVYALVLLRGGDFSLVPGVGDSTALPMLRGKCAEAACFSYLRNPERRRAVELYLARQLASQRKARAFFGELLERAHVHTYLVVAANPQTVHGP